MREASFCGSYEQGGSTDEFILHWRVHTSPLTNKEERVVQVTIITKKENILCFLKWLPIAPLRILSLLLQ